MCGGVPLGVGVRTRYKRSEGEVTYGELPGNELFDACREAGAFVLCTPVLVFPPVNLLS